jgi:hypothetical protein
VIDVFSERGLYHVGLRGVGFGLLDNPRGSQVEARMFLPTFIAVFLAGARRSRSAIG